MWPDPRPTKSSDRPDYWLEQWIKVYRYLLKEAQELDLPILFVEYEELCDDPEVVWKSLANYASLPENLPTGFALSKAHAREGIHTDSEIINEGYRIHSELKVHFNRDFPRAGLKPAG